MTARVRRWRSSSRTGRASLPVRFEERREVAIYETADPEVIVVEYELAGTVTTTGRRAAAPFIGVLRVRAGQITGWVWMRHPGTRQSRVHAA